MGTSAERPRRAEHVVWLLKGSASTPPPRRALRHRNINFPEIRRHYAIAGRRRERAAARATCGRQGAAIKAATLRWRVPPPAKAAKVYVMHAPRTLAASRQPCAAPARIPRPTPAGRALQERARSGAGPPGPPVGGALTVVLLPDPRGEKKGRLEPGWRRRGAIRGLPGPQRAVARARRGRRAGAPGPRAPWPRREMCVSRSVPSAALRRRPPAPL